MVQNTFLDENAAINILVAGGHASYGGAALTETKNGRGGKRKTNVKVAAPYETSTPRRAAAQ
uniref:hypothetical protein n=1 Tax=Okeania sp. SIO2F4 TaxID=2607790 RepID=UPI0025E3E0E0|nr:hypothetical protein [Okeania sp. SIO2F4]